ncbi:GDP-L-fucose synthase [Acrasis kona]|uniref:GDP-L-fucose synthase n=1 Tax=Acrasis kona TaxID=1008807 RepID=A0AAW2YU11_9EUKA
MTNITYDTIPGSEKLDDNDVILVTGGTGLFGKGIEEVVQTLKLKGKFYFAGSKDGNLKNLDECEKLFEKVKPTYVLHLAAFVGGLFRNMKYKVDFWLDNVNMNNNVLRCCHKHNVKKTVSCLSTCIFPDKVSYPIHEDVLHNGPPHFSNDAYAYAKRMLDMTSRWFNQQYYEGEARFTSVIPTNLYGKYDNFNIQDGHVLPGLMHKIYLAQKNGTDYVVYGTGKPLRQFCYNVDAARMILWTLLNYTEEEPLIISVPEEDEVSIADVAKTIAEEFKFEKEIKFDTEKADGQYKKTASNDKFKKLYPDFKFTPFKDAIAETVQWFQANYETVRK